VLPLPVNTTLLMEEPSGLVSQICAPVAAFQACTRPLPAPVTTTSPSLLIAA
jgi:hypothetical protein